MIWVGLGQIKCLLKIKFWFVQCSGRRGTEQAENWTEAGLGSGARGCRLYVREGGVISKGLGSARLPGEPSLHPGNIPGELPGVAESRTSEHAHQHSLYWEKNQFPVSSSGSQPKPRVTPLYIYTSLFSNSQGTSMQGWMWFDPYHTPMQRRGTNH